jgi:hypothetical protein
MNQEETKVLSEKIKKGLALSFQRLVSKTKLEDGELVIAKNGKVIRVKARDLQ